MRPSFLPPNNHTYIQNSVMVELGIMLGIIFIPDLNNVRATSHHVLVCLLHPSRA